MDILKMMKQMSEMQARAQKMQEDLALLEVEGQAGAGLVKVMINGKFEARRLKIDPSLVKPEDVEMLEDLIVAAFSEALQKAQALQSEHMAGLTSGINFPGMR